MMLKFCRTFLSFFLLAVLVGCGSNMAPVTELKWKPSAQQQGTHTVRRGETLYAIAFHYDTDYRTLARLNHVQPPYSLRVGQVLALHRVAPRAPQRPLSHPNYYKTPLAVPQKPIYTPPPRLGSSHSKWLWPVNGRVVTSFIPAQGKKGINIACKKGEKVIASAGGVVAYAGSGLSGYGNLIIIKHSNEYLTAYGNNARIMVSEGQAVRSGQVIAEAGTIEHRYTGLHFEIRKAGTPVNPLNYLQKG